MFKAKSIGIRSLVADAHRHIRILPITSADNISSISPHFTTSKNRPSAFYRWPRHSNFRQNGNSCNLSAMNYKSVINQRVPNVIYSTIGTLWSPS